MEETPLPFSFFISLFQEAGCLRFNLRDVVEAIARGDVARESVSGAPCSGRNLQRLCCNMKWRLVCSGS